PRGRVLDEQEQRGPERRHGDAATALRQKERLPTGRCGTTAARRKARSQPCADRPVDERGPRRSRRGPAATLAGVRDDVLTHERALQAAMLESDVDALDRLLHPELLAVGPDGRLADKAMDLEAHRTGVFEITELIEEEVRVNVV